MRAKIIGLIRQLYDWTLSWAKHPQSTLALAVLSFLEASIFPLPVDPLLLAMGFGKPKKSLYYALITTTMSVLGALGGYMIGVYAWQAASPLFYGYIFSEESFMRVVTDLQGATFLSIFVAGFSPIPFKIFTIAAGVVQAPITPFIVGSILSRGLRYFILGGLIYYYGERAQQFIEKHFEVLTYIVSAVLVLTVVLLKVFLH